MQLLINQFSLHQRTKLDPDIIESILAYMKEGKIS